MSFCLRFAPRAWLKLAWLCQKADTEVGGFGVTADGDPLYITEFHTIKQECSSVSVEFDDVALADFMEDQVDRGLTPDRFLRLWIHTHPDIGANPSGTDEATFEKKFGDCSHAVMFILAKGGETYARLRVDGFGETTIPVEVDWSAWPEDAGPVADSVQAWADELKANVKRREFVWAKKSVPSHLPVQTRGMWPDGPATGSGHRRHYDPAYYGPHAGPVAASNPQADDADGMTVAEEYDREVMLELLEPYYPDKNLNALSTDNLEYLWDEVVEREYDLKDLYDPSDVKELR
jgi:proteasome lid subunit RPN8/RPN11